MRSTASLTGRFVRKTDYVKTVMEFAKGCDPKIIAGTVDDVIRVDFSRIELRLLAYYQNHPEIVCKLCAMGIPTGQQ